MRQQMQNASSAQQIGAFVTKSLIVKRRRWILLSCEVPFPSRFVTVWRFPITFPAWHLTQPFLLPIIPHLRLFFALLLLASALPSPSLITVMNATCSFPNMQNVTSINHRPVLCNSRRIQRWPNFALSLFTNQLSFRPVLDHVRLPLRLIIQCLHCCTTFTSSLAATSTSSPGSTSQWFYISTLTAPSRSALLRSNHSDPAVSRLGFAHVARSLPSCSPPCLPPTRRFSLQLPGMPHRPTLLFRPHTRTHAAHSATSASTSSSTASSPASDRRIPLACFGPE